MNFDSANRGGCKGMASLAMYLFAVVSVLILVANFRLNCAMSSTSDAYDTFASETVEKNGVAQVVKESILAIRETAISNSTRSLQDEIGARLSGMYPAGGDVTVTLSSSPTAVPAHSFFPLGTPPSCGDSAPYAATAACRPLAGRGALLACLASCGPVADLGLSSGSLAFSFSRASASSPQDDRTYVVQADLFSFPLTDIDVVAYGLPITGTASLGAIPPCAPAVSAGFFSAGVSRLIVTSNNPQSDPTATGDLFAGSGSERLPYEYRNLVSASWNAYEYLWSAGYQNALLNAASLAGTVYNFSSPPADPIPGVSASGNTITVDCSAFSGSLLAVADPDGIGGVVVQGSPSSGAPFVLLVRNTTASATRRTAVSFSGDNLRPAIYYLENSAVSFPSPGPQVIGALFLDPTSTASGPVTWFGHLSFYGSNSPLGTLAVTMVDYPPVKATLADLAVRALLVSTSATR